jgi:Putative esterase
VGLTSPALSYVLAALAVGLFLSIIIDWRAMAGRDVRSVLERTMSLVALQAVVLALIFVAVNRSGEFYSSWSDLFGLDKASVAIVASAGAATSRIQPVAVTGRTPVTVPDSKTAGGVLEAVTLNGQLSGLSVDGEVFLPAGYRSGSGASHYPVLVEVSDNLMSTSSHYGAVRLAESAARQIASRQLEPLIIVMLPAAVSPSDQGCLDVPAQPATVSGPATPAIMAATFFTEDLPAILESKYGASTSSANWGLLGDNSGGYCALELALTHSWIYSAAVAPDGTYTQPPGPVVNAGYRQLGQQDDLQWLLRNQPMQSVSVLFTGSGTGGARVFAVAASPPMQVARLTIGGGGWPLAPVLDWIGAAIAPRAGHASQALAG